MVVAELPPQHIISPIQEVRSYYELEGVDSLNFLKQFEGVVTQWQDRPSFSVEVEDDLDTFNHVPFKKAGTIKVRFKKAQPMKPRVIDIEEFMTE